MFQDADKKNIDGAELHPTASVIEGTVRHTVVDEVFGEITEEGPNYRALGWKGTVVLMLKTQIGLGILTIPQVFETIGLIPGVICVFVVASMITWANYIVGVFKMRHPGVYGIEDVGRIFLGRFGYEFFGWLFAIYWVCTASASFIGLSTCFNALSTHNICTAIFVAVATVIGFVFGSIQTLGRISWIAWVGITSIVTSVLVLSVSVGVQDRPAAAPKTSTPWKSDYVLFASPSPAEAFAAVSTVVFAFAGTPAFFNIVSEMRDPRQYTRAVLICQSFMVTLYITIGCVVYYYCGSYVSSPALGSAGEKMKKVCYGLALPGLCVGTAMFVHFTGKYLFLRFMRGSRHLTQNTPIHWGVWISCTATSAIFAYIIASVIPVLSGLVALVGAFGGTLMSMQPMGFMWIYDNWAKKRTAMWMLSFSWVVFIIIGGTFLTIAGSYGAVVGIINDYKATGGSAAWTCADLS
ncbi:transmembrane amino acid transporter protein-domain-containing protein [Aspergillus varians]